MLMESQASSSQVLNEAALLPQGVWIPEVDVDLKPYVDMVFKSIDEAGIFYEEYGRAGGFETRSSSTKYLASRELVGKSFVCSKEGATQSKSTGIRRTGSIRTNCKAIMRLGLERKTSLWVVTKFIEEHNHQVITPSRLHLLKANREVSKAKKDLLKQFKKSNIATCKVVTYLENINGGFNRIGCTERDLRNWDRDVKISLKGHDAQMLIDHFKWQQEQDSSFFYNFDTTDDGKLKHCFWADAVARLNFTHFGDVLSFESTHNTNQYGLVFAAFVGLNHHAQSIFMGCALIPNESSESFEWVFQSFLLAMGRPPESIFTDQDLGIGKALSVVFPSTHHRLCMWHILDKVPEKLGLWARNEKFMTPFKNNIWGAVTPEEFEATWTSILTSNGLENDWLNSLWAIRKKWVPAYHRTHFWAGASSTQRSEGMNSLMKIFVSRKNTLYDFASLYDRALATQRENEIQADHKALEQEPVFKTMWAMEKQMAKVYTTHVFYKFQDEMHVSLMQNVIMVAEDVSMKSYQVSTCGDKDSSRHVTYSIGGDCSRCGCLMLEFTGIPCRHILAVLRYNDHNILPAPYIMRRWTKFVKRQNVVDQVSNMLEVGSNKNLSSHLSELSYWANKVVDVGLVSKETLHLVKKRLREVYDEAKSLSSKDGESLNGMSEYDLEIIKTNSQVEVFEPDNA